MNEIFDKTVDVFFSISPSAAAGVLLTLFAAFFGSYSAFLLENRRRKRAEKRENRAAGNSALLTLGFYWNEIALYKREQIEPFRNNAGRHILIPPQLVQVEQSFKLDFQSLQFIIDEGDVNLISSLSVAERIYFTTVELVRLRSQLHADEVQPMLDNAGFGPGAEFSLEEFAEIVGPRVDGTLRKMTEDSITFVDDTEATLLKLFWELRRDLMKIFPKEKFVIAVPSE